MKRTFRLIAICICVLLTVSVLAACSPSMDELAGTYVGSYVYNGNTYSVAIVLTDDGEYAEAMYKNGSFYKTETGDYDVKGSKVNLYDSDSSVYHGSSTPYKYKNGTLTNNGHTFVKE